MRSFLVISVCFLLTCVGAVAISWTYGPHQQLQKELDMVLNDDTKLSDVKRNYSPYCALGSCPKVAATTELNLDPAKAAERLRRAMDQREFAAGDGDPVWSEYSRKGLILRYQITQIEGGSSRISWEIGRGLR